MFVIIGPAGLVSRGQILSSQGAYRLESAHKRVWYDSQA